MTRWPIVISALQAGAMEKCVTFNNASDYRANGLTAQGQILIH